MGDALGRRILLALGDKKITLDDKTITLRYDVNALCALEDELGMKFMQIAAKFEKQDFGMKEVRALLWAGLLWENPSITIGEAGTLVGEIGLVRAITAASESFQEAFGNIQQGATVSPKKSAKTPMSGTGTS
jgi:hypothetical protein